MMCAHRLNAYALSMCRVAIDLGWPVIAISRCISPCLRAPTYLVDGLRLQAKKKEEYQKKKKGQSTERHNPRAFSVSNIRRTQKNLQRNLDRAQK